MSAPRLEEWAPLVAGADPADVYLEDSDAFTVRLEDGRVEDVNAGRSLGAGMRWMLPRAGGGRETRFASLNRWDPRRARDLAERLLARKLPERVDSADWEVTRVADGAARPPARVGPDAAIEVLHAVDRVVRAEFPHIRQVSATYGFRAKRFHVFDSRGSMRSEARTTIVLSIQVIAERDGLLQTGYEVAGGVKGFELLEQTPPLELARTAARRAVEKLDAPKAPAGEMPVVLAASAGGTFVHEAIGHSLEADHVQEGTSPAYKDKVGKTVAMDRLTIIDDPTLPFCRGSYVHDDEGCPAAPTKLVENGALKTYLYDRLTAEEDGVASNAHGRRESFQARPVPRMSNIYIAPGDDDPREILRSLKKGIYVTRMGGGQVNTANGEFVFEVDEGWWVEDGEIKRPVRDANLLGVGPEVLASIDRLGRDIGWSIGTCGKAGQSVPVSDGQPTLRIPKILVGGAHE